MDTKPYKSSIGSDRRPCVDGPGNGFGYNAGTLWPEMRFSSAPDAEAAAKCCNEAYEQGRIAARREMRKAMGLD
jgi:hypothetical protein